MTGGNPIAVYVVDDDAAVRRSSWFMLTQAGFAPRVFSGGADFLGELPYLKPGVVLLDLRMPDVSGFDVLQATAREDYRFPAIVVTGFGDVAGAVRAMKLGAIDFIEKPYDDGELATLIDEAARSSADADDERRRSAATRSKLALLTSRERDVLALLLAGLPNKLVAYRLQLSTRTVEMHRANMMARLGVSSFPEAMRLAITAGFEVPDDEKGF